MQNFTAVFCPRSPNALHTSSRFSVEEEKARSRRSGFFVSGRKREFFFLGRGFFGWRGRWGRKGGEQGWGRVEMTFCEKISLLNFAPRVFFVFFLPMMGFMAEG